MKWGQLVTFIVAVGGLWTLLDKFSSGVLALIITCPLAFLWGKELIRSK